MYQVSSKGRVRSLTRTLADGRTFKGKTLKTHPGTTGYPEITLPGHDRRRVHRLMAEAFLDNPFQKPFVLHSNGVRDDNRIENLRWGTNSENLYDAVKHGTYRSNNREKSRCKHGHEFTSENTYTPPGTNYRYCRQCIYDRSHRGLETDDPRHGTGAGYSSGCRCPECKAARASQAKERYWKGE